MNGGPRGVLARVMLLCAMIALAACSDASTLGDGAVGAGSGGVGDLVDGAVGSGTDDSDATEDDGSSDDLDASVGDVLESGETASGEEDVEEEPVVVSHLQMFPADSMVIEVDEGEPQPLGLSVELVYSDGTTVPVEDAIWTTSNPVVVGVEDGAGPYATAIEWGQALVLAYHQGMSATCSVTVKVNAAPPVFLEGMSDEEVTAFEAGAEETSDGAPVWRYPEDQTVFPCGMYPPLLQWDAKGNEYFRLVFSNQPGITVSVYTTEQTYQPTRDLWQAVCDISGGPLTMVLTGRENLDAASPKRVAGDHVVRGANASLEGIVYYWQILPEERNGSIMQIDSAAPVPSTSPVFPDGTTSDDDPSTLPGTPNPEKTTCRGCHALSLDGSKLAYGYSSPDVGPSIDAGAKFVLAVSWAEDPLPEIVPPQPDNGALSVVFDPTGSRLVVTNLYSMWLARLDESLPAGFEKVTDIAHVDDTAGVFRPETPAWSPDGSTLVYARRALVDNVPQGAALVTTQWNLETEQFEDGAVMLLDVDAVEGRPYHDYPTWSPDSRWIVARSSAVDLGVSQPPNSATSYGFTLIDATTGEHRPLNVAAPEGDIYGRPSFSPFTEGGYFWLAFYTTRPYGVVNESADLEQRKQIWVMAIDADPADGVDPSHPSFWLPGQSIDGINLSAFWARPTCAVEDDTCGEDGECCVGLACVVDPETGAGTCQPAGCDLPGQFCDLKEETCCPGYSCQVSLSGAASCQLIDEDAEEPEDAE